MKLLGPNHVFICRVFYNEHNKNFEITRKFKRPLLGKEQINLLELIMYLYVKYFTMSIMTIVEKIRKNI